MFVRDTAVLIKNLNREIDDLARKIDKLAKFIEDTQSRDDISGKELLPKQLKAMRQYERVLLDRVNLLEADTDEN